MLIDAIQIFENRKKWKPCSVLIIKLKAIEAPIKISTQQFVWFFLKNKEMKKYRGDDYCYFQKMKHNCPSPQIYFAGNSFEGVHYCSTTSIHTIPAQTKHYFHYNCFNLNYLELVHTLHCSHIYHEGIRYYLISFQKKKRGQGLQNR